MTATDRSRWRWAGFLLLPAVLGGCLSMDEPPPTSPPAPVSAQPTAALTPTPTEPPRASDELVIAVPELPDRLLPPAGNIGSSIVLDLVHETLYRFADDLTPVPDLAAALPETSHEGRTWTIPLALDGMSFASGRAVTAADVAGSLAMAGSPVCGLDRSLCATALSHLVSVQPSEDGTKVVLELDEAFAPFLAEVLAQVPIVDMAAVEQAATTIVAGAGDLDPHAPDKLVTSIYKAVGADQCIAAEPPKGCRLADHRADLEGILTSAGVSLPTLAAFTDETGQMDEAAYANALLDRVAALGQVLTGTGTDRQAATLGLMDGLSAPLGAGPYRVTQVVPGERMELAAVPGRKGGTPIKRIRFEVVQDPAVAATRLLGGDVDWVPQLDPSLVDGIDSSGRAAHAAVRPLEASWVIVFNTRDGRPYTDAPTRAAFTDCIDREGLTRTVGGGDAILADTPLAAGSWAMDPGQGQQRDVANAKRLLDLAGWTVGDDGIRVRGGHRLSSTIALRSSQVELLTMLQAVASQLRDCGIELDIQDLDVTGDQLLDQMRWPNDFDTLLTLRSTGVDPDADLIAFEGSHATSADQEIDANPGGFSSKGVDRRIAEARHTFDQQARGQLYREVQDLLATEAPAWWVWYDSGWSAIADRVRTRDGRRVDPSRPRYEHDVRDWTLAVRGAGATGTPSPGPAATSTVVPGSPSDAP